MEANEIQEFSNQLKEAAGNEQEAGEANRESLTTISLAISILAVLVAMVTVLGHRSHTEAVLMQSRAGDQWNEYQSKKIRMDSLSVTVDLLTMQPATPAAAPKLAEYTAHIAKWKTDLVEEQNKALEFEAEVTHAEHQASHYDLGEALLQIAVVLCSVTLFTRNRRYFFLGISIGVIGLVTAITGFFAH